MTCYFGDRTPYRSIFGQSSPMTLLWTLVGLSPAYQISGGVLEALSGVLLLFRRTALVGALTGFVVMANVTLLNLCFDVPVKLGALLISFALAVTIAPDMPSLLRFFLRQARTERSHNADLHKGEGRFLTCMLYRDVSGKRFSLH